MAGGYLSDLISVRGRFHRSVNLERDWRHRVDLAEYVVTPTISDLADRFLAELRRPGGTRAWSITGPYGSGKSAFALFLADLLGRRTPTHPGGKTLRRRYRFGNRAFLPVLIVAERAPLIPTLLSSLKQAFAGVSDGFARKLGRAAKQEGLSGESVAKLVEEAAERAHEAGYAGILVVVDEMGKFLEYAATQLHRGDLFFLQQLAEAAARCQRPILLATVLHSGFADYLAVTDEVTRNEWQKVQGRFRDVPFQLPAEQVLALIGHALSKLSSLDGVGSAWRNEVEEVLGSEALAESRDRLPLESLLHDCVPLHPITALVLWPLFRSKVAQNERSLFAFLASDEPFSFQHFLNTTTTQDGGAPFYRLGDLYDYVSAALGLATFRGDHARKWALIDHALSRIPADSPETCRELVKTIGLLGMYGAGVGLKATNATLEAALPPDADVSGALLFLESHSIVVHRRHLGAYSLWEGSDVDLDEAFQQAQHRVGIGDLASRLRKALQLQPIVARAHYIETGTLRFFDVDIVPAVEETTLREAFAVASPADGRILFAVGSGHTEFEEIRDSLVALSRELGGHLDVIAIPRNFAGLGDALKEVESWLWVAKNIPGLQGDSVARQEVRARISAARDRLEQVAGRTFGLPGSPFEPARCAWICRGEEHSVESPVGFQRWISHLCDEAFSKAPRFHNELLNRHNLSSAAAAARRNLLERMVANDGEERLGIEGTPADASMYQSMLRGGGMHRSSKGIWSFGRPRKGGQDNWWPAWNAVTRFVRGATTRRPVVELFDLLRSPPFGLRDGPLPVLLLAVLLAHRDQMALYEEGVFVPELRVEVIERLVSRPETFEIQSHRLGRQQRAALEALQRVLNQRKESAQQQEGLLPVVKSLVLFAAKLDPYTRRTRKLSPPEAAVRSALLDARDPRELLFETLPNILGLDFRNDGDARAFGEALQVSLRGIARAYPDLLDRVERQLREVFRLSGSAGDVGNRLAARAAPLVDYAVDQRLRLFVREAAAPSEGRDWRETLGRVVNGGLPPSQWSDEDASAFQVRLQEVASEFDRLEELVLEKRKGGASTVLRIGILDGLHQEQRAVIALTDEIQRQAAQLAERVTQVLDSSEEANGDDQLQLAALARVVAGLLKEEAGRQQNLDYGG